MVGSSCPPARTERSALASLPSAGGWPRRYRGSRTSCSARYRRKHGRGAIAPLNAIPSAFRSQPGSWTRPLPCLTACLGSRSTIGLAPSRQNSGSRHRLTCTLRLRRSWRRLSASRRCGCGIRPLHSSTRQSAHGSTDACIRLSQTRDRWIDSPEQKKLESVLCRGLPVVAYERWNLERAAQARRGGVALARTFCPDPRACRNLRWCSQLCAYTAGAADARAFRRPLPFAARNFSNIDARGGTPLQ